MSMIKLPKAEVMEVCTEALAGYKQMRKDLHELEMGEMYAGHFSHRRHSGYDDQIKLLQGILDLEEINISHIYISCADYKIIKQGRQYIYKSEDKPDPYDTSMYHRSELKPPVRK